MPTRAATYEKNNQLFTPKAPYLLLKKIYNIQD